VACSKSFRPTSHFVNIYLKIILQILKLFSFQPTIRMSYDPYAPFPNTLVDIKSLVTTVVHRRHPEISYIALFGSFAQYEQDINSDIDIVIGYQTRNTAHQIWDTGDLAREFEYFSDRAFDIVYVRDNEPPHWTKPMHGLLEGLKIYERDAEWYPRNQALALRHLAEQDERGATN
jgi:predicted nucleotidyltransferase